MKLTGDISDRKRKDTIKQIHSGHFQILIATGQLVGEGADFDADNAKEIAAPGIFSSQSILRGIFSRLEKLARVM